MRTKPTIKKSLSSPGVRLALLFVQRNSCHNLTLRANGHWLQSLQIALSPFRSRPLSSTPLQVTVQLRNNSASLQLPALSQLSHLKFLFSSECFLCIHLLLLLFTRNQYFCSWTKVPNCYADFPSNLLTM